MLSLYFSTIKQKKDSKKYWRKATASLLRYEIKLSLRGLQATMLPSVEQSWHRRVFYLGAFTSCADFWDTKIFASDIFLAETKVAKWWKNRYEDDF